MTNALLLVTRALGMFILLPRYWREGDAILTQEKLHVIKEIITNFIFCLGVNSTLK